VVALEYSYDSRCIVIRDKNYRVLGEKVRNSIKIFEQKAITLPNW